MAQIPAPPCPPTLVYRPTLYFYQKMEMCHFDGNILPNRLLAPVRVLNLYAGIGGNRKHWENVEVTAVENNESIAKIYQDFYPNDKVIVADAHQYLQDNFMNYDFIWSSPPCPTHSRMRFKAYCNGKGKALFPDMKLYEEILFLQQYTKG
ncbi:MAG: DNA cytosine methyltransferase, partial [Flavobacteriaceae bacterium]|nr:DNA cytosine methyltransferase [Flavobacteriaceae bacterium]